MAELHPSFDWRAWRKAERERLIAARLAMGQGERETAALRVAEGLDRHPAFQPGALRPEAVVAFYWPFRGELDLRAWIAGLAARGIAAALPVVTEKARPMQFRLWRPGMPMERGIWNIPVPTAEASGAPVIPDVVIAPLVGFSFEPSAARSRQGAAAACYRLGYGGGYFDRTLAALAPRPLAIGVGYALSRLATIVPQPHDIPLDGAVTEDAAP